MIVRTDRIEDDTGIFVDVNVWQWNRFSSKKNGGMVRAVQAPHFIRLIPTDCGKSDAIARADDWLIEYPDGELDILSPARFKKLYASEDSVKISQKTQGQGKE